jgi:hypothetical protein
LEIGSLPPLFRLTGGGAWKYDTFSNPIFFYDEQVLLKSMMGEVSSFLLFSLATTWVPHPMLSIPIASSTWPHPSERERMAFSVGVLKETALVVSRRRSKVSEKKQGERRHCVKWSRRSTTACKKSGIRAEERVEDCHMQLATACD